MDNIKDLQEEIFCLKFELETLSEHLVKDNLERMLPNYSKSIIEYTHKERYKLITDIVENKEVIDIACGTGYGSFYLAQHGNLKNITGYDLSSDTIRYASYRYKHPNLSYKQGNAEKLEVENKVDVIVSYETIEHLSNYKAFLEAVSKNLKRQGLFIVSTPISHLEVNEHPHNPYHTREWGFQSFQNILSSHFDIETIYVQLYQHCIANDKIMTDFRNNIGFIQKFRNKIRKKIRGSEYIPPLYNLWNDKSNYPVIEKYQGQYKPEDLGSKYIGYQIAVCKNKV